jgi:gamma-glutamylaminecyclotransferase
MSAPFVYGGRCPIQNLKSKIKMVNVFVYGTLLPNECNHHYLANAVFVADDAVENAELFNEGSYPMLRPGMGRVYGQLYRVPLADLESLDELEEHPDFFDRQFIRLASGQEAWVYFGPEEFAQQFPKIPSGCWRDR